MKQKIGRKYENYFSARNVTMLEAARIIDRTREVGSEWDLYKLSQKANACKVGAVTDINRLLTVRNVLKTQNYGGLTGLPGEKHGTRGLYFTSPSNGLAVAGEIDAAAARNLTPMFENVYFMTMHKRRPGYFDVDIFGVAPNFDVKTKEHTWAMDEQIYLRTLMSEVKDPHYDNKDIDRLLARRHAIDRVRYYAGHRPMRASD